MDLGCCFSAGKKCWVKDDSWAECAETCEPNLFTHAACQEVRKGGHRVTEAPTPPPVEAAIRPATEAASNESAKEAAEAADPASPAMDDAAGGGPPVEKIKWIEGTWTAAYWDCCKPSCAWDGMGKLERAVKSCDAKTGKILDDTTVASVCTGGTAGICPSHVPFVVADGLSMGFAAVAGGGASGLEGDKSCGQCFELVFTAQQHVEPKTQAKWGGAHPNLVDKRMIIQVVSSSYDTTKNRSFELLVPGSGQGAFSGGCAAQYEGVAKDDFDCGNRHGGCKTKEGCAKLPPELRKGCEWRHEWYKWLAVMGAGRTNSPFVKFRRVMCPEKLSEISGSSPSDDGFQPQADLGKAVQETV